MSTVNRKTLRKFLKLAGERLRGDWVVIGGTVLPLLGIEHRVTYDIDIAGPREAGMDQTLVLMEIAEQLELPVEAINQAGAYFLHRIDGWEEHIVSLHQGKRAAFFRPDVTLFVLLKISRLLESDLADCQALLAYARRHDEYPDRRRLQREIQRALNRDDTSLAKQHRLEVLLEELVSD